MDSDLKPQRYPQGDLFVCDITDVILKDDLASMEHPFYSLSKRPDREPRRYEHAGNWIEFRPSIKGLPTIYDKDLIIYAISQLIAGIKQGREISKSVEIDPYAFLKFTQRGVGGRDYDALADSLDRIDGTRFRTNALFGGTRSDEWLGIIDGAKMQTDEKTGKLKSLTLRLSDMVVDTVKNNQVLTLHRDYFRLRKPIERRVYEIARKSVGQNRSWSFLLPTLHTKSGSKSSVREFRRQIKTLAEKDFLPDYRVDYDLENDKVTFWNRSAKNTQAELQVVDALLIRLDPDTYETARSVAPGWDIYMLEQEWRSWMVEYDLDVPKDADKAFLGFCRKWHETRGEP